MASTHRSQTESNAVVSMTEELTKQIWLTLERKRTDRAFISRDDLLSNYADRQDALAAMELNDSKISGENGWITRMGAGIVYKEGDAPTNVHVRTSYGCFVPEMIGALTACRDDPHNRPQKIAIDDASVLS